MIKVEVFHNSILKSCSYCIYDDIALEGFVIDVGDADPIVSFINENKIIIKGILLTHPHFDHVYGIMELYNCFPSIDIYCSKETIEGLRDEDVNMSYMFLDGSFKIPHGNKFIIIEESSKILCSGSSVCIISCPGHDSGCISFVIGNNIFTGDSYTPFAPVTYNWHRSDKQKALKNEAKLEKYINSKGLIVYPGHYQ